MKRLGMYIFLSVAVLLATSFILFFLNKERIEITSPSNYVRIDSLRFCGVVLSDENRWKISICGSVVADKTSIPMRMYLYEMPGKILVAENQVSDRFSIGDFVRHFDLPDINTSGSYKIVAYFYKNVVGEVDFEINSP